MSIYFDLCAIQRPLDDRAALRVRVEADAVLGLLDYCRSGAMSLVGSSVLGFETERCRDTHRRVHTEAVLAVADEYQHLTSQIEDRADDLVIVGFRPLDALHLACAEAAGALYLCTCDDGFLRRGRIHAEPPLRVMTPIELITELNL